MGSARAPWCSGRGRRGPGRGKLQVTPTSPRDVIVDAKRQQAQSRSKLTFVRGDTGLGRDHPPWLLFNERLPVRPPFAVTLGLKFARPPRRPPLSVSCWRVPSTRSPTWPRRRASVCWGLRSRSRLCVSPPPWARASRAVGCSCDLASPRPGWFSSASTDACSGQSPGEQKGHDLGNAEQVKVITAQSRAR